MRFPKIKQEWVFGVVVGIVSGYYIFNDILRNIGDQRRKQLGNSETISSPKI